MLMNLITMKNKMYYILILRTIYFLPKMTNILYFHQKKVATLIETLFQITLINFAFNRMIHLLIKNLSQLLIKDCVRLSASKTGPGRFRREPGNSEAHFLSAE